MVYDVFLSHNSEDKPFVRAMAGWLKKHKVSYFLDEENLLPGDRLAEKLGEAMEESRSAIVCIGPNGNGWWQSEEIGGLFSRAIKLARQKNEFRIIPVRLPNADTTKVPWFLESRLWIDLSKGITDNEAELLRLQHAIRGKPEDSPICDNLSFNPYRGLEVFEEKDAPFFFGRAKECGAFAAMLKEWRFVCIVGQSGNGKSSLARAGLSTDAAKAVCPELSSWKRIVAVPGSDLLRALLVQLFAGLADEARAGAVYAAHKRMIPDKNNATAESWASGLDHELQARFPDPRQKVLILIDQFEEIFTHRSLSFTSEQKRQDRIQLILDALALLMTRGSRRWHFVLTLRSDFYQRCRVSDPLWKTISADRHRLHLDELDEEGWRAAIKGPAVRAGAYLETGLVETMLKDVYRQRGSMPLLQLTLQQLWRKRQGACLTHAAYTSIGGVANALQTLAESALEHLKSEDPEYLEIARNLFLRLTSPGEGVSDTRRRLDRSELDWENTNPQAVDHVLAELSGPDNRLIVADAQSVEVTHEVLIREGKTIRGWIELARKEIPILRRLTYAAQRWNDNQRDPIFLNAADPPRELKLWVQKTTLRLTHLEREYWKASRKERTRMHRDRRTQRLALLTAERERVKEAELRGAAEEVRAREAEQHVRELEAALAESKRQLVRAQVEEGRAWIERSKLNAARGNNFAAALMAARAVGFSGWGRESLQDAEFEKAYPVLVSAEASASDEAEAQRLVSNAASKTPTGFPLWRSPIAQKHAGSVTSVAWSPNGKTLASGAEDNTVKLWDASTGRLLSTLEGHAEHVTSVAWSPDGKTLASGARDRTIKLWDASTGTLLSSLEGHAEHVTSVAWSPDGKTLASGARDRTIKLWDASTGTLLSSLEGHADSVSSVEWSPDGKTLASGAEDNTVKLWDASTGRILSSLEGHAGSVSSVAWSSDGKTLASGARDKTVKLWDASTGRLLSSLRGHADGVFSMEWSPDGKTLASGARDKTVKLWDASTGRLLSSLEGHAGSIFSVAWSPDGKTLASGAEDSTVKLWDASTGTLLSSLEGHAGSVNSVAWSPDRKTLASGAWDKTVKLWDASTGRLLSTLEGHAYSVTSVAWSPDGKTLASGAWDDTVKLWDASTGRLLATLEGHAGHVTSVAWSPDGKTLASGASDSTVKLWDASMISEANLVEYLRVGWVELKGSEVVWRNATDSLFHDLAFPVVNVRSDSLLRLPSQQLVEAEEREAELRLLLRALNFPSTIAAWSAQASETPADAPSRRLFLGAICAQAADDLPNELHWRALWLISHLTPAFTAESFADPHVSLGALRLATVLSTINSDDPQFTSVCDPLLSRLHAVAPTTWQEALKQAVK